MSVRVAVVDGYPVVRAGLRAVFSEPEFQIVFGASGAHEAELASLNARLDLLVIELCLPGPSGASVIRHARRQSARTAVLVLSAHLDPIRVADALQSGAHGYASKLENADSILQAARTVLAGRRYLSPHVDAHAVSALLANRDNTAVLRNLSAREREIFDLIVRGHSTLAIARQLFISRRTVDSHRAHIFEKVGVHSIADLVRLAARFGLLAPDHAGAPAPIPLLDDKRHGAIG